MALGAFHPIVSGARRAPGLLSRLLVALGLALLPAHAASLHAVAAPVQEAQETGAADGGGNPMPVRSNSPWGQSMIAEGCERSPSFRALVAHLRRTRLIVYVEPVWQLRGVMAGSTSFLGGPPDFRYLRVAIDVRLPRKNQIALLGHELQHATEIADAPDVVDEATLKSLYERIGDLSVDGYDTRAARTMGETVFDELWAWQPPPEVTRN